MKELVPITIDLTYFYSLTEGDKAFEKLLLQCTIDDFDLKIKELRDSLAIKDFIAIRANAHSLISLSAIVGIPQIEEWSRTIAKNMIDGIFYPQLEILINCILAGWPIAKIELIKNFRGTTVLL